MEGRHNPSTGFSLSSGSTPADFTGLEKVWLSRVPVADSG